MSEIERATEQLDVQIKNTVNAVSIKSCQLAIEALEKQTPKKIEDWNGQASCPNCKKVYGNIVDIKHLIGWEFPHCKWCGQKLDWSVME